MKKQELSIQSSSIQIGELVGMMFHYALESNLELNLELSLESNLELNLD